MQSNRKPSKRIKSVEGCSWKRNDDDLQRLSLTKRVDLFQYYDKEEETNDNSQEIIKTKVRRDTVIVSSLLKT